MYIVKLTSQLHWTLFNHYLGDKLQLYSLKPHWHFTVSPSVCSWTTRMALTLLQRFDGALVELFVLCITSLCTQEASRHVLCGDSYCRSIFIFLPSLAPGVGTHLPSPAFCSPVWQGSSPLASQSPRDSSSAQKHTWQNTPACALASLPSAKVEKYLSKNRP